jgi:hypothetical protein
MLSTGFAACPQPSATAWVCGKSFCYTNRSALEWSCHPYQDDGTGRPTQSKSVDRGVAQPGRAPGSGPGGRRFESSLPDHLQNKGLDTINLVLSEVAEDLVVGESGGTFLIG